MIKSWTVAAVAVLVALINWAGVAHADPAPPPDPATAAPAGPLPDTANMQLPNGEKYSVSLQPDPPPTDNDVENDEALVIVDW
jgi:hypothetical protein